MFIGEDAAFNPSPQCLYLILSLGKRMEPLYSKKEAHRPVLQVPQTRRQPPSLWFLLNSNQLHFPKERVLSVPSGTGGSAHYSQALSQLQILH